MFGAEVTTGGDRIRWIEIPASGADGTGGTGGGDEVPVRVYLHGLGASSGPYFTAAALHPLSAAPLRPRSLLLDLLGFGISDRPEDGDVFGYTMEEHADAVAAALRAAGVRGADVVAHSMGGTIAVLLAHRHPGLVGRLVLVDANLDRVPVARVRPVPPGSSGIASYGEEEFVHGGGREEVGNRVGPHWWATMRLAGRVALHRSATHLTGTAVRSRLMELGIPRTYLHPLADGPVADAEGLTASGVRVVPVPDCGHNIMLDNPHAFATETAAALRV